MAQLTCEAFLTQGLQFLGPDTFRAHQTSCSLCQEPTPGARHDRRGAVRTNLCSHIFHPECLFNQLHTLGQQNRSAACPTCGRILYGIPRARLPENRDPVRVEASHPRGNSVEPTTIHRQPGADTPIRRHRVPSRPVPMHGQSPIMRGSVRGSHQPPTVPLPSMQEEHRTDEQPNQEDWQTLLLRAQNLLLRSEHLLRDQNERSLDLEQALIRELDYTQVLRRRQSVLERTVENLEGDISWLEMRESNLEREVSEMEGDLRTQRADNNRMRRGMGFTGYLREAHFSTVTREEWDEILAEFRRQLNAGRDQ